MPLVHKNKITITDQKKFQRRLSHYLRDYAGKKGLLLKEVAQKIGYSEAKFAALTRADEPHGRFITSLDFLKALASLEKLSISDFISLLEGGPKITLKDSNDKDELIVKAFKSLKASKRKKFIEFLAKSNLISSSERELFVEIIDLVILLIEKNDLKKVQSIKNMLI